jgi:hypothetical protein
MFTSGIFTATAGTVSLLLSTAVLYLSPRIGFKHLEEWAGVVLIGTYIFAIIAGGLIGSVSGFLLTRKLLPRRQLS